MDIIMGPLHGDGQEVMGVHGLDVGYVVRTAVTGGLLRGSSLRDVHTSGSVGR